MRIYNPPFPPLEKGGVGGFEKLFLGKSYGVWDLEIEDPAPELDSGQNSRWQKRAFPGAKIESSEKIF